MTSEEIQTLCRDLDLTRKELGRIVFGAEGSQARKMGSRLATNTQRGISGPVRLTLERLRDGRLSPEKELEAL